MANKLKFGNVLFKKEGQEITFHWSENPLTVGIMYWFSNSVNMYGGATMKDVKRITQNIKTKFEFLSEDNLPNHPLNGKI